MHGRHSLIALTLALTATTGGVAHAAPTATLGASATLLSQPKGGQWAIGLGTSAAFAMPDGSQPPPVRHMQIRFPQGKANWDRFPACSQARLEQRKDPDGCPAGSRIGKGTSTVWARPIVEDPIPATIDVFNGARSGSGRTLLFLARTTQPISTQIVLKGVLRRTTGAYGFRLDVDVPRIQTIPGSPDAAVVAFSTLVQARRRGVSYLEAPRSCPRAGLPFAGTFTFSDGSTARAGARIPCTLSSVPARR
jgi:hypothetical protein